MLRDRFLNDSDVSPGLTLLEPGLLGRRDIQREIDRVVNGLGLSLGWHYRLDIAWLLGVLERVGLRRGAIVLDAGAGLGPLQFVLAERGYRVLSVDFAERQVTRVMRLTHRMEVRHSERRFEGEYIAHLERLHAQASSMWRLARRASRVASLLVHGPGMLLARAGGGSVEFVTADMTDMTTIPDACAEAVVSVSAIEHLDRSALPRAVVEFRRVLKTGGVIVCTTSAAAGEDWFHEPSKGWCFSQETLCGLFGVPGSADYNAAYATGLGALKENDELRRLLPDHYRRSGDNGMPWGVWDPTYMPVGVVAR